MAVDEKISQLPEALTLAEDDYVPIVQASSGLNKKAKVRAFVPDPSFIENIVVKNQTNATLEIDKINWVTLINDHTMSVPTPDASNLGMVIIVNNRSSSYSLTITGVVVMPMVLTGRNSIVGVVCVTDGVGYGWEVFSRYNVGDFNLVSQTITNGVTDKAPSQNAVFDALALKLDLDGGNANQDIDIGNFSLNARHVKINGTGGTGHIGLKHQSANITASASESSIGADYVGDPVWKNDGGAIDKLELQSNKTSTVTGNEASTSKYLTVKGVYNWAVGLFAKLTGGQLTGALNEAPTVTVASATTTDIGSANSASVDISSTTTITGFGTVASGIIRNVRFTGALTLTHNATSLILPNATNITTQSGDTAIFRSLGSGNWICVSYKSVTALANLYTPYWDGTKLVNSDLYRASGAGQTGGIATRSARLFQAFNFEANTENALGVYKQINTNIYDAQIIYSHSRGLSISANNAPSGSASLSNYALRVDNNTTNGSYTAWLQATDKTLAEAQLTAVNSGTIIIRRDGTISSATPPVNYNTGFYFEIRPSTDLTYNKYGNFYLALIDVANKKSGFQWAPSGTKRMTLHEDGGLLIGTGAVPNASAALDVDSTIKGFLPPRMTNAQRTSIASPAIGLMVYCTDTVEGLWINKSTGWTFIA